MWPKVHLRVKSKILARTTENEKLFSTLFAKLVGCKPKNACGYLV